MRHKLLILVSALALSLLGNRLFAGTADEVGTALDEFHQAAAHADLSAYLSLMTDDVVFLGTDGSERWEGPAFRSFVSERFNAGKGWLYTPQERNIAVSADGRTAWFDEKLDNASLGACRGSGVLVKGASGWQIAQYNLSVPIPNGLVDSVVEAIDAGQSSLPESAAQPVAPLADAPATTEEPEKKRCPIRHKTVRAASC